MVRAIVYEPDRPEQAGPFASPNARSGARPRVLPLRRHEDLMGFVLAHWTVVGDALRGYWLARCDCCGNEQEIRLDNSVEYVPRCTDCGASEPRVDVHTARAKFIAWTKGLRSEP